MRYYIIDLEDGTQRSLPNVVTILDLTMPQQQRSRVELDSADKPRNDYIFRYVGAQLGGRGERLGHGEYGEWLRHLDPWLQGMAMGSGMLWSQQLVYDVDVGYAGVFQFLVMSRLEVTMMLNIQTSRFEAWPVAIALAELEVAAYAAAWNRRHHVLRASHVAVVHLSPCALLVHTVSGDQLAELTQAFYRRVKQFHERPY